MFLGDDVSSHVWWRTMFLGDDVGKDWSMQYHSVMTRGRSNWDLWIGHQKNALPSSYEDP